MSGNGLGHLLQNSCRMFVSPCFRCIYTLPCIATSIVKRYPL